MKRRRCFFCRHVHGKRTGEDFAFACDVSGKAVDPEADACKVFAPESRKPQKKTPPAARQGAELDKRNCITKPSIVRKAVSKSGKD